MAAAEVDSQNRVRAVEGMRDAGGGRVAELEGVARDKRIDDAGIDSSSRCRSLD
jgi:hypothetical protein